MNNYTFIVFAVTLFLTVWLNAKFIKDASGRDQYWHHVQLYQQIWIYLSYGVMLFVYGMPVLTILFRFGTALLCWALMYMLLYNSILNAMRTLNITHLGRYDVLKFWQTAVLFLIGITIIISLNVFTG